MRYVHAVCACSGVARMTELPGHCVGMHSCIYIQCLEAEKQLRICAYADFFLMYIIFSYQEGLSYHLYAFQHCTELDSGLFLAAAAAEGVQQSNGNN